MKLGLEIQSAVSRYICIVHTVVLFQYLAGIYCQAASVV
jgi:hypothetical protein